MCLRYNMINLHPAAPGGPAGTWQEVIWQLIRTGAHKTGVMMHLVTPELDRGPVVTYCIFSIRGSTPFDGYWQEIEGLAGWCEDHPCEAARWNRPDSGCNWLQMVPFRWCRRSE
jgi:hypothetical protein